MISNIFHLNRKTLGTLRAGFLFPLLLLFSLITVPESDFANHISTSTPTQPVLNTNIASSAAIFLPDNYVGVWSGSAVQTNPNSQWTISLAITKGNVSTLVGTASFPSVGCGAELTLLKVFSNSVELLEDVTFGSCWDLGRITLIPNLDGTLTYKWRSPDNVSFAEGTVHKISTTSGIMPDSYMGVWKGSAVQTNPNVQWPILMTLIKGSVGTVSGIAGFAPYRCGAELTLLNVNLDSLNLLENVTYGSCWNLGTITLKPLADGSMEYRWDSPDHQSSAVGNVKKTTLGVGPGGNIITPADNLTVGPSNVQFSAQAWDDGSGIGVGHVEFYVKYNELWKSAGMVSVPPYQVDWLTPNLLRSQTLEFSIHVVDNAGNRTVDAGGIRHVIFRESLGNPDITENWIPTRFYLNQNSLTDKIDFGYNKCSAASMAMVLAMNGLIASDYDSMAAKANEMYPNALVNGAATIWKMVQELNKQPGAISTYNDGQTSELTNQTGWQIIKREIDAGEPVIVRTTKGVMTNSGHFVVAVGYREQGTSHQIVTYDPYGEWKKTKADDYWVNSTDKDSHVGSWVSYDFDQIFANYVITTHRNAPAQNQLAAVPSTPPDEISDEPRITGVYQGDIPIGNEFVFYIPSARK